MEVPPAVAPLVAVPPALVLLLAVPCPPAAPAAVALLVPEVDTSVSLAFAVKLKWASAKPKFYGVSALISIVQFAPSCSPPPLLPA